MHPIDLMHSAGLPGTLNEDLLQSILLLDLPGTPNKELLQSILLLEVACWIQTFDCKNLGPLLLFASKHTMAESAGSRNLEDFVASGSKGSVMTSTQYKE
jgi:hypothetical protein